MPLSPTPAQRRLLERHLDELDVWNRRLNLTSVPRTAAWDRHVVESLTLLGAAALPAGARCADLGSGGGLPGIPVAILRRDLEVTLVEADRRKAGFLVHVCGLLDLGNVRVVDRRAEQLAADPLHRAAYDVVLSRAAAPPLALWALAVPLLREHGSLWALTSSADADAAVRALVATAGARAEHQTPGVLAVHRVASAA